MLHGRGSVSSCITHPGADELKLMKRHIVAIDAHVLQVLEMGQIADKSEMGVFVVSNMMIVPGP